MFPNPSLRRGVDAAPARPRALLTEFERYADAQQVVDQLSDQGFPILSVDIVWDRLRLVENVTGRQTVASAFVRGLASGAWIGALVGLLLIAFVELDEGTSALAVVLSYAILGALIVGSWQGVGHWLRQGRRDFRAVGHIEAERYQVWVDPELLGDAQALLGRPRDPEPTDLPTPSSGPPTSPR